MTRWSAGLLALMVWGCDDGGSTSNRIVDPDGSTADRGVTLDAGSNADADVDASLDPDAGEPPLVVARDIGRMTIEQLARSIPVVTEGLRWTQDFGQGETDLLVVLAATLGAPDYINVTDENLEPTLIIAKFMQDASHGICSRWVTRDRSAETRSLVQHDGDWASRDETHARAALQRLQMRFYARQVDTDSVQVDRLYTLFLNASNTAQAGRETADGWLAVCIALMTDPEFILY